MKFVIRKVPERDTSSLEKELPDALVCNDIEHIGALNSFFEALKLADDDAVYLQDDIVLCKNFKVKCEEIIRNHSNSIIVFSSYFHCNENVKNAFRDGGDVQTLCVYIPKYIADAYLQSIYSGEWKLTKKDERGQFDDLNFGRWLRTHGIDMFVVYPNLAGHLPVKSVINKSRPKNRICKNFDYHDTAWDWEYEIRAKRKGD